MNEDHVIFLPSRCLHLKFGAFLVLSWRRDCKGASAAVAPMQFRRLVAQDQESPWRPLLRIGCSTSFHSARMSMIDSSRTCSCHCMTYKYNNLWRISIFACSTLRVDDRCRSRISYVRKELTRHRPCKAPTNLMSRYRGRSGTVGRACPESYFLHIPCRRSRILGGRVSRDSTSLLSSVESPLCVADTLRILLKLFMHCWGWHR